MSVSLADRSENPIIETLTAALGPDDEPAEADPDVGTSPGPAQGCGDTRPGLLRPAHGVAARSCRSSLGRWRALHDFPPDLRDEIAVDNADFNSPYKMATGDAGQVTFGSHAMASGTVVKSSIADFQISTSPMGLAGVWLIDNQRNVAEVPYGLELDKIDDPGTLHYGESHYAALGPNQIAWFRCDNGYLLLKNVSSRGSNVIDLLYQVRGRPSP